MPMRYDPNGFQNWNLISPRYVVASSVNGGTIIVRPFIDRKEALAFYNKAKLELGVRVTLTNLDTYHSCEW